MPDDIAFRFIYASRMRTISFPQPTRLQLLPTVSLSQFLQAINVDHVAGRKVDIVLYESPDGVWREITRGQPDEFYELWRVLRKAAEDKITLEPMIVKLYFNCTWLPHDLDDSRHGLER